MPTKQEWILDFDLGHVHDQDGDIVCYLAGGPSERSKGNGRKIAAAPELLEALQAAVYGCPCTLMQRASGHAVGCFAPHAKEVLRKAQGE